MAYFSEKSDSRPPRFTFEDLQCRLAGFVRIRINNGEFTERGLARVAGISQPQIHNFLKGTRRLSPEFADRLMCRLRIGILDLFEAGELLEYASAQQSPKKPVQSESSSRYSVRDRLGT